MSKINPYTAKLLLGTSFILAISLTSYGFAQSGNGQFPGSQPPPSKLPTQELPNQLPKIVQKSDANNNESGFPKLPDNFPPIKTSDQVNAGVPPQQGNNELPKTVSNNNLIPPAPSSFKIQDGSNSLPTNPNAQRGGSLGDANNQGTPQGTPLQGNARVQMQNNNLRDGYYDRYSQQTKSGQNSVLNQDSIQPVQPNFNALPQRQMIQDRNVVPSSVSSPLGEGEIQRASFSSATPRQTVSLAKQFLDRIDINKIEGSVPGEPVALARLMQVVSPGKRKEAVEVYWNCFKAYANLRCVESEQLRLERLPMPGSAHEQAMLRTALTLGKSRLQQATMNLEKSQRQLSKYAQTQHRDILPMAKDMPWIGPYQTKFETLSAKRTLPNVARQLHLALPKQKQLIDTNAKLIQQSEMSVQQTLQAYSNRQATLSSILESMRLLQQSHQQFVDAVTEYNLSTSEYAFSVASPYQPAQTVAAMLIPASESLEATPSQIANMGSVLEQSNVAQIGRPVNYEQPIYENVQTGQLASQNRTPVTSQVNPNAWQNQGQAQLPARGQGQSQRPGQVQRMGQLPGQGQTNQFRR